MTFPFVDPGLGRGDGDDFGGDGVPDTGIIPAKAGIRVPWVPNALLLDCCVARAPGNDKEKPASLPNRGEHMVCDFPLRCPEILFRRGRNVALPRRWRLQICASGL